MHSDTRYNGARGSQARLALLGAIATLGVCIGLGSLGWAPGAQAQSMPPATGDAQKGKTYFLTYKCYACHGYTGQTGVRRLVPMRFPQEAFVGFVQNSPIPDMPAYRDVPAAKLADLYAYIRSIPVDAPEVASLPLLNEVRARAAPKR
jgi:hypothetical protein